MLIILDGILGEPEADSLVRRSSEFVRMAEVSRLTRVDRQRCETPESSLLGLAPHEGQLRQGPLTVSALGWDPPDSSLHFHLSLLSLGAAIQAPKQSLTAVEFAVIKDCLARLNTKKLTTLLGQQFDHGLVWERMGEMFTTHPSDIRSLSENLPVGDGEVELRRFIDDSVNLLQDEDFNRARIDKGLDPVNLAWPWGHGYRTPVPNLALRYGFPYRYESNSTRLAGLVRLGGFRHGSPERFGNGVETRFEDNQYDAGVVLYLDQWHSMRQREEFEELEYLTAKCGKELIKPMLDHVEEHRLELRIILLSESSGIAATFSENSADNHYPLDERSLLEPNLLRAQLFEFVRSAIA